MDLFVAQLLNGLVYGVLLFLMAAGLSLIFGLMNVVSLAHGSFFMLGAFVGLAIFKATGSFWLALLLAPFPVIVLGVLMERVFLRPLYKRGHMDQVLLTFGFTFVFLDLVQTVWGRMVLRLPAPQSLQGVVHIGAGVFSAYRLFLIGFGFAVALLLWLLLEKSRIGAMVRAGVDNAMMASGLGANIPALFTGIFGFGVALAALGGIAAAPVLGLYPGMDSEILIPAFIVIVIGGMGSLRGAFVGSLLIGIADTFGKAYFQSIALFLIYLTMTAVLLVRPQGLFGIKYSDVAIAPAVTTTSRPATMQTRAVELLVLAALIALPFRHERLSARIGRRNFHLRDLRHEPRSSPRIYRPDVARPCRLFRAWRLCGRDPRRPIWVQCLARSRRRCGRRRRRRRPDRLFLRAHRRHSLSDADARLLAACLLRGAEMARRHRRLGRHGDCRTAKLLRLRSVEVAADVFHGADLLRRSSYWGLRRLLNSPLGHAFVGIRENEQRMSAIGYPTRAYKLIAFTIAGAVAGVAGGLYAIFNGFISSDALYWTASGDILIMTMLGGAGTLIGPAIGTAIFLLMKNVASSYSEHWLSIIGVTFICCVMFFPGGLWGSLQQMRWRRALK